MSAKLASISRLIEGPGYGDGWPLESNTTFQYSPHKGNVRIVTRSGYRNGVWRDPVIENVTHLVYSDHVRDVARFLLECADKMDARK